MEYISEFISMLGRQWMPHGRCIAWNPAVLGLAIPSDLIIWFSYFWVPARLLSILKRRGMQIRFLNGYLFFSLVFCFALFIFLCGQTHLMKIITVWYGVYFTDAIVSLFCAIASLGTAVLLEVYDARERRLDLYELTPQLRTEFEAAFTAMRQSRMQLELLVSQNERA